ncbi:helix-turn-helix domain-containing protein [Pseudofrankia asymbiotica]|uniref:RNA polymerase subunit sigma-70 n=1 Tax=Pseudofrankia asymbiotica TaxID=1834516 RepID=A0A1V2I1P3_9ACTN|nr:helix-turn-helix domain-containing protein [Pseudofrankia asymbiotica]ONH23368.1 RNA polymerase subunit sigma-70 [Pseudofrankia asymbiotica]
MTDVTRLAAAAAAGEDPGTGLAAIAALRELMDQLEALHVSTAREQGWTWEQIAQALGVTRQAVHRKYVTRALPGWKRS